MFLIIDRMCLPVQDYSIPVSRILLRQRTAGYGKQTAAGLSSWNKNEVDLRFAI
jgi:hypothetical protein